eukprot:273190-Amphidinium_carterae.1
MSTSQIASVTEKLAELTQGNISRKTNAKWKTHKDMYNQSQDSAPYDINDMHCVLCSARR